jgi:murein DD-endopeptidase MepM/ murein hydrolase activator NlpD
LVDNVVGGTCMVRGLLVVLLAGLVAPPAANAYGWPVKPFHRMHAIRGTLDDPRFHVAPDLSWRGSFHFGVDISAPDGTPVYAVEPGTIVRGPDWVSLRRPSRREFGYWHVRPVVSSGQHVRMHQLLGYIIPGWGHVHFAETVAGRYRNPLRHGGLTPFKDTSAPVVAGISVEQVDAHALQAISTGAVSGTVALIADAYELPPLAPPAPWDRARLVPSLVRWRLIPDNGDPPTPWRIAVDFRFRLLPASAYSTIYAPGTYQNKPNRPGDYRFWLVQSFDTSSLPNGTYYIEVEAENLAGHVGEAQQAITIENP